MMRFTCSAKQLIEALGIVTKALSSRTTNRVLEGILLEANEGELVLTCSDERLTITTSIDAEVMQTGRGVVPKLFNDIVRRLPDETVTVDMDDGFVFRIRSASSRTNITGMDADLFPRRPAMDNVREISLPQDMLKDMIGKTEFAIAVEDMREVLTGAYLEIENGVVSMVALDGYRLALRKTRCSELGERVSAIIPGRALGEIGKLLSDDENDFCSLGFGGNKLHLTMGETEVFAILVDGEYIQYRHILPKSFVSRVELELSEFRSCVDRAALIARDGSNNLIQLEISGNTMTIEAHSQLGDVHEEMEVEHDGDDMRIAFNVKYITDVVRFIGADRIRMSMNNSVSPCIITPADDEDYVHLILPVRTGAR